MDECLSVSANPKALNTECIYLEKSCTFSKIAIFVRNRSTKGIWPNILGNKKLIDSAEFLQEILKTENLFAALEFQIDIHNVLAENYHLVGYYSFILLSQILQIEFNYKSPQVFSE